MNAVVVTAWLLVFAPPNKDQAPSAPPETRVVVPGIASQAECNRLATTLGDQGGSHQCVRYQAVRWVGSLWPAGEISKWRVMSAFAPKRTRAPMSATYPSNGLERQSWGAGIAAPLPFGHFAV